MNRHVRHNSPLEAVLAVIYYESFGVMKERTDSQQGLKKYPLRFSSDNHLKHILTYTEQGFSSEKYSPHSSSHPLLLVHRVELVNKLVEVVGGLHDRTEQGHQRHIVALCVELWSKSARFKDRQAVREGADLSHNLMVVGQLTLLHRTHIFQNKPHLDNEKLLRSQPEKCCESRQNVSFSAKKSGDVGNGKRAAHPAGQHLDCRMLGHQVICSPAFTSVSA